MKKIEIILLSVGGGLLTLAIAILYFRAKSTIDHDDKSKAGSAAYAREQKRRSTGTQSFVVNQKEEVEDRPQIARKIDKDVPQVAERPFTSEKETPTETESQYEEQPIEVVRPSVNTSGRRGSSL